MSVAIHSVAVAAPVAALAVAACGAPAPPSAAVPEPPVAARIVAAERGPLGGRLVLVGTGGERIAPLTEAGSVPVLDSSPRFSPDGRHIVFVSTRGRRSLEQTSLWLLDVDDIGDPSTGALAEPRRLTLDKANDRDPAWMPDGKALVFSSNRAGTFDLWMQPVAPDRWGRLSAHGPAVRLTTAPGQELSPSVSADGARIVYMAMSPDASASALETIAPAAGQTPRRLTDGPGDFTPSWFPDGRRIVFAAPTTRAEGERADADLYVMDADGSGRRLLVDEPLADQTGPQWSRDGRFLFAISVYRSVASGEPVLASLTFVDMTESPPVLRALHDPVAVESRTGATIDGGPLDVAALRANRPYRAALKRAVEQELIRLQERVREQRRRDRAGDP